MMNTASRIIEDRAADLHYAFQFGQDFAREAGDPMMQRETKQLFQEKFGNDAEAQAEFDRGVSHQDQAHLRTNG